MFSPQLLYEISLKNTNAKFIYFTQTILDFKRIAIQDVVNNETNSIENLRSILDRQQISDKHTVLLDFIGSKIDNLEIASYVDNESKSKSIEQLHQNLLKVFKTFEFIFGK